jgi:hypothetical protein
LEKYIFHPKFYEKSPQFTEIDPKPNLSQKNVEKPFKLAKVVPNTIKFYEKISNTVGIPAFHAYFYENNPIPRNNWSKP